MQSRGMGPYSRNTSWARVRSDSVRSWMSALAELGGQRAAARRHECQELHALSISSHVHGFMIKTLGDEFGVRASHRLSWGDVANMMKSLDCSSESSVRRSGGEWFASINAQM